MLEHSLPYTKEFRSSQRAVGFLLTLKLARYVRERILSPRRSGFDEADSFFLLLYLGRIYLQVCTSRRTLDGTYVPTCGAYIPLRG